MNIRIRFSLLLALLLTALFVTPQSSSAVAPQKGLEAFGEGQFSFPGTRVNFSFDAEANQNRRAHGQAHFTFTSLLTQAQTEITVRIKCLSGDPIAVSMSGFVQDSDDPKFPKHAPVVFAVVDINNSPIPGSGVDQITPPFVIPEFFFPEVSDCRPPFPLTILNLDFGSIEIVP